MKVPLLDLSKQYEKIHEEIMEAVKEVFDSQRFILGPKVEALEERLREYCGSPFALGVSSGTDALLISLMSLDIGPGDLVMTTPYSFFATGGAISRVGARPVFVDIDRETYNIDPVKMKTSLSSMGKAQLSRVKAVLPVHLFGQCAAMEPLLEVARDYGLKVIEDSAQAIGAEYRFSSGEVKRAGSMSHCGCFSFYPTKNLGSCGEAGLVTTHEEELWHRLRVMRNHGDVGRYAHKYIGGNFRLDALQAAVLLVKLQYLEGWTEKRRENARLYRKLFGQAGWEEVSLPLEKEKRHIYHQFVIKVEKGRDELRGHLIERGVGCEVYYPIPLHLQACFKDLGYEPGDFPGSEEAAKKSLALPVYPELSLSQIEYVVDMIADFFEKS